MLSNMDKRAKYDFDHHRNPQVLKADILEQRGRDGVPFSQTSQTSSSSFAEDYRLRIQRTRADWNIDEMGNYKGGLPRRHRGKIR